MEAKTSLYDVHVALGGKMVPFAGYLLPIQYSGIIEEHMAVRERAGIFDVSHMGEVDLIGTGALRSLNHLCSNEFSGLAPGRVRYTVMLNHEGGIKDDFLVYCIAKDHYRLVVNAANRQKDVQWIVANVLEDTTVEDISDSVGQVALQGPEAQRVITKLTQDSNIPRKYYSFVDNVPVGGVNCLLSRTGYTGSHGFEIYCKAADTPQLWKGIMEAGAEYGILPCGLGARDTLRLEASMPLYGHELAEDISPLEAGLDFAVRLDKSGFIGKDALVARGQPTRIRVGLKVTGRGIVREGCRVFAGDKDIGLVTSGTHLPYMKGAYAMALLDRNHSGLGTVVSADVRGKSVEAQVCPMPFYKP
jgi:aminomethyltransferase